MDDIIQVLIFLGTIIIFIVSAVAKQKKKPNQTNKKFDNVLEELFGFPSENPVMAQNPFRPADFESQTVEKSTIEAPTTTKEGVKAIPDDDLEEIEESADNETENNSVFDLRQAVIFSEILNRKYQ